MHPVPILFGLGCGLAVWLTAPEAKRYALCLLAMWAAANALWFYDRLEFLPVLDLALGAYVLRSWPVNRPWWVTILIQLIALRLILHVLDYATGNMFLVPYIHGLNLLFMLEIGVVCNGGTNDRLHLLRGFRSIRVFLRPRREA